MESEYICSFPLLYFLSFLFCFLSILAVKNSCRENLRLKRFRLQIKLVIRLERLSALAINPLSFFPKQFRSILKPKFNKKGFKDRLCLLCYSRDRIVLNFLINCGFSLVKQVVVSASNFTLNRYIFSNLLYPFAAL